MADHHVNCPFWAQISLSVFCSSVHELYSQNENGYIAICQHFSRARYNANNNDMFGSKSTFLSQNNVYTVQQLHLHHRQTALRHWSKLWGNYTQYCQYINHPNKSTTQTIHQHTALVWHGQRLRNAHSQGVTHVNNF